MKKMKLFLLAAMIIGMGSAFTTTKVSKDGLWVKGPNNGPAITYEEAVNEHGGFCNPSADPYCVFENEALTIGSSLYTLGTITY